MVKFILTIMVSLLIAGTASSQQVWLKWNGGDPDTGDVVTYTVEFSQDSTFSYNVYTLSVTAPWDSIRQCVASPILSPLTTYYWQVEAKDTSNATSLSDIWRFTTSGFDITKPSPFIEVTQSTYLKR